MRSNFEKFAIDACESTVQHRLQKTQSPTLDQSDQGHLNEAAAPKTSRAQTCLSIGVAGVATLFQIFKCFKYCCLGIYLPFTNQS